VLARVTRLAIWLSQGRNVNGVPLPCYCRLMRCAVVFVFHAQLCPVPCTVHAVTLSVRAARGIADL
jgi:hypothetical protein